MKVNSMEANEGTAGCCVYSVLFTLAATSLVELHKSLHLLLVQSDWFSVFALELCRLFKTSGIQKNNSYFLCPSTVRLDFVILYFPLGGPCKISCRLNQIVKMGLVNCTLLCLMWFVLISVEIDSKDINQFWASWGPLNLFMSMKGSLSSIFFWIFLLASNFK